MRNTPGVQILRSKPESILWILVCAAFVVYSFWDAGFDQLQEGLLGGVFFGLVGIVLFFKDRTYLRIDEDGFTYNQLIIFKTSLPWTAIDRFFVSRQRQSDGSETEVVSYNFVPDYDGRKLVRKLGAFLQGAEASLPDTYGLTPDQLAELLANRHYGATR
jgi:hypothetical protein